MNYELDTARRYRAHAKELRVIAGSDGLKQTKQVLLDVAESYDKMARDMEELHTMRERHGLTWAASQ